MSSIAVCIGPAVIRWSSVILFIGLLACLSLSLSLQHANGGRSDAMLLFFMLALVLSVPICRFLHWYCHREQYSTLLRALTDYFVGSFCLPGALAGAWLAARIVKRLRLAQSTARLLDAFAPGAAVAVAFIRLSALFGSSCRGKITVRNPALQRLPFATAAANSSGTVEYHFAAFFAEFLLMMIAAAALLVFFYRRRQRPMKRGSGDGDTARAFLLLYSVIELLTDSTRNDSSFMKFNGFVSIVQMICAIGIAALLVYYSAGSIKANGLGAEHWLLWGIWLLGLAGTGVSEYLVQRHGNWYLSCYTAMTICCALMGTAVCRMYAGCCDNRSIGTIEGSARQRECREKKNEKKI